MKKRWRKMAACFVFLLDLPMGCGMAEEGQNEVAQTDPAAVASTSVVQDPDEESMTAGKYAWP